MQKLRKLHFTKLDQATAESQSLLKSGYVQHGNWTLAQICRHLYLVQDASIAGYPKWMSLFAFLRPLFRRLLLPRLMQGNSPTGIRTAGIFVPAKELDDAEEVTKFMESAQRFEAHSGPLRSSRVWTHEQARLATTPCGPCITPLAVSGTELVQASAATVGDPLKLR